MTPRWYVPRRTVLRGMGTAVALPFLEAMVKPRRVAAALDPKTNPRRFVGIWAFPCGLVGKWDPVQSSWVAPWTPSDEGPLSASIVGTDDQERYLAPFFDPQNKGVKGELIAQKLTIPTGLSDVSLYMHQGVAAMLTPGRLECGGHNHDEGCQDVRLDVRAPSADQIVAQALKPYTNIPFLAMSAVPTNPSKYGYELFLS